MTSNPLSDCPSNEYSLWKAFKLEAWGEFLQNNGSPRNIVELSRLDKLQPQEISAITEQCRKTNICFYRCNSPVQTTHLLALGKQLGLGTPLANPNADENNVSLITAQPDSKYIPYSCATLHWHTDGYYNSENRTVQSFIMHCETPALHGGTNAYFDSDILYILLYDADRQYINALTRLDAMTIPANYNDHQIIRKQQTNSVFASDQAGNLLMRYTQRKHHVIWNDNCRKALQYLNEILDNNKRFCLSYRLKKGEGVICNNIVHNRSAFKDGDAHKRLIYRLRYTRRIPATFGKHKHFNGGQC